MQHCFLMSWLFIVFDDLYNLRNNLKFTYPWYSSYFMICFTGWKELWYYVKWTCEAKLSVVVNVFLLYIMMYGGVMNFYNTCIVVNIASINMLNSVWTQWDCCGNIPHRSDTIGPSIMGFGRWQTTVSTTYLINHEIQLVSNLLYLQYYVL